MLKFTELSFSCQMYLDSSVLLSVFSVSECNLVLIKSLFKSSFSQSNVVLRGRFVICSGDLCVVDNAGRQAIVIERALFFRSAVAKAFVVVVIVVIR